MAFKKYNLPPLDLAACLRRAKNCWSEPWFGLLPEELQFEAETSSGARVRVVGFCTRAPYTSKSWVTLDNSPSYLVCKKLGKTAKNYYRVYLSSFTDRGSEYASISMGEAFKAAFNASPYAAIHQEHLRAIAKGMVKRIRGNWSNGTDTIERYANQNPFFEEEMNNWNREATARREDAQLRVALAKESALVSFHVGLHEKLNRPGVETQAPLSASRGLNSSDRDRLLADSRNYD